MAEITYRLADVADNYRKLCARVAPAKVLPFLKGDGYGVGIQEMATTLADAGADAFCTARPADAAALRILCPAARIYLCSVCSGERAAEMLAAGIVPTVDSAAGLRALCASVNEQPLEISLAIDTGMGRFGLRQTDFLDFCKEYHLHKNIRIVSTFTHYYRCFGSRADARATFEQHALFVAAVKFLTEQGVDCGLLHASNSAAALLYPDKSLDAVRAGSALLGRCVGAKYADLTRVGRLSAEILSVRELRPGQTVGYGGVYRARKKITVAVLDAGHADGLFLERKMDGFRLSDRLYRVKRAFSEKPLCCTVNSHTARLVGRVGLTNCIADVSGIACAPGDRVTFDFNPLFCGVKDVSYEK